MIIHIKKHRIQLIYNALSYQFYLFVELPGVPSFALLRRDKRLLPAAI
jgi:hypothetical protein